MEQHFITNDILEAKMVPVFPLAIGTKAYELLHSLIAPNLSKDKRFNDLVKTLCVHLKPKPFVIVKWFKLHKGMQQKSVVEYIVTLKYFTTHCDFGKFLNNAFHDQLVVGLH